MDKKSLKASGLIESYILGLTTREQDTIVEKLMETDPEIKKEILEAQDALFQQAKTYAKTPLQDGKRSIMKQIDNLEDLEYSNVSLGIGQWLKYAAVGILLISSGTLIYKNNALTTTNKMLSEELSTVSEALAATDQEKTQLVSNEYILTHSATAKVQLKGTNLSPEASMLAFYNPKAEVLMIKIDKLPPPETGKYYHMWADVNGVMQHVGKISNDAISLTSLNFVAEAESLNITLEDSADVDHPDVSRLALSGKL